MIIGYIRSLIITIIALVIGGTSGMFFFLLLAMLSKSLLEAINYIEHYGLVRERGKPIAQYNLLPLKVILITWQVIKRRTFHLYHQ
jgi:alkane 1-monooxygenase